MPRDLRYAARMVARTPAMTFTVALTMALAIGATTVIFSAVDALMLRSAPVADPGRVVSVYTSNGGGRVAFSTSSYPDYVDLRDSGALDGLAAFAGIALSFDTPGETLPVTGEVVSGNYFDVLGCPSRSAGDSASTKTGPAARFVSPSLRMNSGPSTLRTMRARSGSRSC